MRPASMVRAQLKYTASHKESINVYRRSLFARKYDDDAKAQRKQAYMDTLGKYVIFRKMFADDYR